MKKQISLMVTLCMLFGLLGLSLGASANGTVVSSISASPSTVSLEVYGQNTQQLTVLAKYSDGSTSGVTQATYGTLYSSSNELVASVSGDGLVTAKAAGTATIAVQHGGAAATVAVIVNATEPVALDRTGWVPSASSEHSQWFDGKVGKAIDGDKGTRWSTGQNFADGQWYQVDMLSVQKVSRVVLDARGLGTNDAPLGFKVFVSSDGVNWGAPVAEVAGSGLLNEIRFPVQSARFLRVVHVGARSGGWWSIFEFNVYGLPSQPLPTDPVLLSTQGWTAEASPYGGWNSQGVQEIPGRAIDGDPATRWSTGATPAPGQFFKVDMKQENTFSKIILDTQASSGDYPRGYAVYVSKDGTNWGSPVASGTGQALTTIEFSNQKARYIKVEQTGTASGSWWCIHEFKVYGVSNTKPAPAPTGPLPAGWNHRDIGFVENLGVSGYSNGVFTLQGSGNDIWDNADGMQFAYQPLVGNGTIVGKVLTQTNTNAWAKAGLMIRETLEPGSKNVSIVVTPSNGLNVQSRSSTNGQSSSFKAGTGGVPVWFKLMRVENSIYAYTSKDGVSWSSAGKINVSMNGQAYFGLAVTSHNNAALSKVEFSDVVVSSQVELYPDLMITDASISKLDYKAGDKTTFTAMVKNNGIAPIIDQALTVDFKVNGQLVAAASGVISLGIGESKPITSSEWTVANTTVQLEAVADPTNQVVELVESNNTYTRTFVPIELAPYKWDNVLIGGGGYVTGLVFHPKVKDLMYIRTDVGGVFRWDPTYKSWTPLSDWIPQKDENFFGIDGIALDPNNPDVVYIAAGASKWDFEGKPSDVMKSMDRGATWKRTNLNKTFFANEDHRWNGEPIAVDPNNSDIVFVGTRLDGLWKSSNATSESMAWTQIPSIPTHTHKWDDVKGVRSILFDPNTAINGVTQTLYVGVIGHGIFKSTDGGATFKLLAGSPTNVQRLALADGVLFVTSGSGVLKFENGAWANVSPETGTFNGISVDPTNPQNILVSRNFGGFWNPIWRTTNAGLTWTNLTPKVEDLHRNVPWWPDRFGSATTAIVHDPHDPKSVWLTDWYGIWHTPDITAERPQWYTYQVGQEEMVVFDMASPPTGEGRLFTALADNDGMRHTDVSKYPVKPYGNPGMSETTGIDYSEGNPSFLARIGSYHWGEYGSGGYSTDNGVTWKEFPTFPIDSSTGKKRSSGRIAVSSATDPVTGNPAIVILPRGTTPKVSKDNGQTWIESTGAPSGAIPDHWAQHGPLAADKVNGNTFYLYKSGSFYVSNDSGVTWTKSSSLPDASWNHVKAMPGKAGEVWVAVNTNGLYRSTNFGTTFTKIANVQTAYLFSFGKEAPGEGQPPTAYVYGKVNGETGIFRSTDLGMTWVKINDDSSQIGKASTMEADRARFGVVYVGTGGRGVFYGAPAELDLKAPRIVADAVPEVVREEQLQISGVITEPAEVKVNGYSASLNAEGRFTVNVPLQQGLNNITLTATDAAGNTADPVSFQVTHDPTAVLISLDQKSGNATEEQFLVSGKVNAAAAITVNGDPVQQHADLSFTASILLKPGMNDIVIVATDGDYNTGTTTLKVNFDRQGPVISLDQGDRTSAEGRIIVSGRLNEAGFIKLNGKPVKVNSDYTFAGTVNLANGSNSIMIEAYDLVGNISTPLLLTVVYNQDPNTVAGEQEAYRTQTAPVIDGVLSERIWLKKRELLKEISGNPNNLAAYAAAWDDQNLYVGVQVTDDVLMADSDSASNDDSIEVYLDGNKDRSTTYDANDRQIAIKWNGTQLYVSSPIAGLQYQAASSGASYSLEMAIPWASLGVTVQEGKSIGFDVAINDDDDGGNRDSVLMWNGYGDNWRNTSRFGTLTLTKQTDITAPVTTHNAPEGWQRSEQTIQLSATDDLTGVSETYYSVGDAAFTQGSVVTLSQDGIHTLRYYSVDLAGNVEEVQSVTVSIDTTGPAIADLEALAVKMTGFLTIEVAVSDSLSGVMQSEVKLDGAVVSSPLSIQPLSLALGEHTLSVQATDVAGNTSTKEWKLMVTFSLDDLDELIVLGGEKGWITNEGIVNSLLAKSKQAQRHSEDPKKVSNSLNALQNEVEAQAGKKITDAFAKMLLNTLDQLRTAE